MTLTLLTTSHTLCMTSDSDNAWHLLHYTILHILALCHQATIFHDITPTIFYILSTVSVSQYPLYRWCETNWIFEISSAIYDDIISILFDITATECVLSHPLYRQHHTHSLYDITLAICVASFALHKTSHPHFMTSNHRVYVSTPTILTLCPLCLCHHIHCVDDITQTVFLRSHLL